LCLVTSICEVRVSCFQILRFYLIKIVNQSDEILSQLGTLVKETIIPKSSIGWDLEQLEAAVRRIQNDSNEREPDSDDESEGDSSDSE